MERFLAPVFSGTGAESDSDNNSESDVNAGPATGVLSCVWVRSK